jgi:hypothetical protein
VANIIGASRGTYATVIGSGTDKLVLRCDNRGAVAQLFELVQFPRGSATGDGGRMRTIHFT